MRGWEPSPDDRHSALLLALLLAAVFLGVASGWSPLMSSVTCASGAC
jgi:hypothetical protein